MMIWCNGVLRRDADVRIAPEDRGFTLGDGVFETLRIHQGHALHVDRHLYRLRSGATVLGIEVFLDDIAITQALQQTMLSNGIVDGSLRLTLSRGPAARGIATPQQCRPTLLISAFKPSLPPGPASLIVSASTRRNEFSPLSRIKSLNYLDSILARREAEALNADDALLPNTRLRIAEATTSNLIVVHDGELLTPPVTDGALPGIARSLLLERQILVEAPVELACLRRAETLLLCSSLGLRSVSSLEGRSLRLRPDLVASLTAILLMR